MIRWYRRITAAPTVPDGLTYPATGGPDGAPFKHGIQITNDDQTPVLFVVEVLQKYAGQSHGDATTAVAICHSVGGVIISMESVAASERAASQIASAAELENLPLRCKPVVASPNINR